MNLLAGKKEETIEKSNDEQFGHPSAAFQEIKITQQPKKRAVGKNCSDETNRYSPCDQN